MGLPIMALVPISRPIIGTDNIHALGKIEQAGMDGTAGLAAGSRSLGRRYPS